MKTFTSPKKAYDFAIKHGKLDIHGENIISQDAEYSYYYAKYIIKGRFELGENAISQYAYYAYRYAKNIIKERLPEEQHNEMILLAMHGNKLAKQYLGFINKSTN